MFATGAVDRLLGTDLQQLLLDDSTFALTTIEELLDAEVLPVGTAEAFQRRYLRV